MSPAEIVADWNRRYPTGTSVRVNRRCGIPLIAPTAAPAELCDGTPVVLVGIGLYPLDIVEPVKVEVYP